MKKSKILLNYIHKFEARKANFKFRRLYEFGVYIYFVLTVKKGK